MRYLAWVAIFSLQMGMFVCGAGIDVCHAADAPAHIEVTQSNNNPDAGPVDSTCAAHAAHVFINQDLDIEDNINTHVERADFFIALHFSEIFNRIEQPPRFLHS